MTRAEWQCDLTMSGVLLQDGEARQRRLDIGGHAVPVLCLLVETESVSRGHALVEQPFPEGHGLQCEAAARRYKKGMRVSFEAPTVGIQLLVRNARHVHLLHEESAEAAPAATA
jgi:hypothetical protein